MSSLPKVSDSSHKFGGPQGYPTSDQLATNLGVPMPPLRCDNSLVLRKVLYLQLYFIIANDTPQNQPKKEIDRADSGGWQRVRVPNTELLSSLKMPYPTGNPGSSPGCGVQRFYWGSIT